MVDKKNSADDKPRFFETIKGFWVFACVVVVLWLVNLVVMSLLFDKPDQAGTAGDMFGAATSLFSGLAFAGLLTTLFMQRRELALQRGELELSRDKFRLQRFENTLFALTKLFNDHVSNLAITEEVYEYDSSNTLHDDGPTSVITRWRGRDVISQYIDDFQNQSFGKVDKDWQDLLPKTEPVKLVSQIANYEKNYSEKFEPDLGPYFRLLYNSISHIEKSNLTDDEKQTYSKIVRAYLSSAEVKLLMFNCASSLGENFKDWVIKYKLLNHLRSDEVDKNPNMVRQYPPEAFDNRLPAELFERSPPTRG